MTGCLGKGKFMVFSSDSKVEFVNRTSQYLTKLVTCRLQETQETPAAQDGAAGSNRRLDSCRSFVFECFS